MYSQDYVDTQWTKTITRRNTDLFVLERMRYSANLEQPVAVLESTETSADELHTPVEEVENHTCTTPRKKRKEMERMYNDASMLSE